MNSEVKLKRATATMMLLIDIALFLAIAALTLIVAETGRRVGSEPMILEIREDGDGKWYMDAIKLQRDYVPTDAAYTRAIKSFIRGLRMIESHYDTNKDLILTAMMSATGNAERKLEKKLLEENPFERSSEIRIDVPTNSIKVHKVSQSQWKASWRERTYNSRGTLIMEEDYEAVFHTRLMETKDVKGAGEMNPKKRNPLGIFIYEYDIDLLRKLR